MIDGGPPNDGTAVDGAEPPNDGTAVDGAGPPNEVTSLSQSKDNGGWIGWLF